MGSNESKEALENEETKRLREIAEKDGPSAVAEYIKDNMNRWKKEPVKFAVTGRSATGKSTFINAIRDVHKDDENWAKPGRGNTTTTPTCYVDPKNSKIEYWDLPGVGTMSFKKNEYISGMKIYEYDYFFIFFENVISEDDHWLVTELNKLTKPFCLVRSKIDDDIVNAKFDSDDGDDDETIISEIRLKVKKEIERYPILKSSEIFLISSRRLDLGDFDLLVDHMEKKLPSIKFEVLLQGLARNSHKIIEKKYKMLKKRIVAVTTAAATISAIPVPGLDVVANIAILVEEVIHYTRVFGLTKTKIDTLKGFDQRKLKCRELLVPGADFAKIIAIRLATFAAIAGIESMIDFILPVIGSILSATTTAVMVYRFLSNFLKDVRDDAITVFKFITVKKV